ncbi:magnesium/cobalt transporter CorA [Candidatus Riflebacteria bacterium]
MNQLHTEDFINTWLFLPQKPNKSSHSSYEAALKQKEGKTPILWLWCSLENKKDVLEENFEQLDTHPLIIEDILNLEHPAKIEDFEDDTIFIIFKSAHHKIAETRSNINICHNAFIIKPGLLISFHENVDLIGEVEKRLNKKYMKNQKRGLDFILYTILDTIVDEYFVICEKLLDRLTLLEGQILVKPTRQHLKTILRFKKKMSFLKKSLLPHLDIFTEIKEPDHPIFQKKNKPYFNDIHDHQINVLHQIDTIRDNFGLLLDVHISSLSLKMNEIMKVLTLMAGAFIPLTFLAGVYGMNFKYIPGLEWAYGFHALCGVMLFLILLMLYYFKTKEWL